MGALGFDLFIAEAGLSEEFRTALATRIRRLGEASCRRIEEGAQFPLAQDTLADEQVEESVK